MNRTGVNGSGENEVKDSFAANFVMTILKCDLSTMAESVAFEISHASTSVFPLELVVDSNRGTLYRVVVKSSCGYHLSLWSNQTNYFLPCDDQSDAGLGC